MKVHTIIIIFLLGLFSASLMAQNRNNDGTSVSISASATVISGGDIEMETISDMGILDASRLQEGLEIIINPVFDAEAGIMRARGQANAQIRVSYIEEMEIARREGPGTLFFVYEISGYPGDNQRESELLDLIEREMRFNEEGEFYFWVGGRIDLSEALPGSYDGEFTIEIEYM